MRRPPAGLRFAASVSASRERRAQSLFELTRELSAALESSQIATLGAAAVQRHFGGEALVLVADPAEHLRLPAQTPEGLDASVADWTWRQAQPAGLALLRDLLGWSGVPVIVLSSRVDEAHKIAALDAGAEVHLTPTEYRLLTVLAANAGRVRTQRQLLREVWGPSHVEHSHYLRVYMAQLRQKFEADPAQPRHLLTETAVGYRLVL